MCKDILLSLLAAVVLTEHIPWSRALTAGEKWACIMGFSVPLLFFCLFCGILWEKWRERRKKVQEIRRMIERLREGKRK